MQTRHRRKMAFRKHSVLAFIFFSLSCFSCVIMPEKKIDSVYVMVYDYDNNEVMNVSITVDEVNVGTTDIHGRLMFASAGEKECSVVAEKEGYETVRIKSCIRPGQLIYFRMGTGTYYARKAELLLDGDETEKALKMLDTALGIQERKDWRFLRDVILRRLDDKE